MGKKKFDKNKGVTFKLAFRSEDETANSDQTLSERIFSVIEDHKKKADKSNDKERQKILSQFTKEDLGQAPIKKPKSLAGAATAPPRDGASSQVKGRDDLWITHVMRMKEQAKAQAEAEEAEEAEEEERRLVKQSQPAIKKAPAKKKTEEEEEWESCEEEDDEEWEDEDEEEEIEEEDEEDEEQEQEQQEDVKLFKKKAVDEEEEEEQTKKGKENVLEEIQVSKNAKAKPVIVEEEFPALGTEGESSHTQPHKEPERSQQEALEELAEEEIDLKKINVKGNVRMKRYDDLGIPMDGYNYYQHIVDANSGGAPSFSFTAQYDQTQQLPEDVDLRKEKMNAEEKEVYEALEQDGEAYEDLDDDFFATLTKAEAVVVEEGDTAAKKDGKKVTFGDNEIKEILTTKDVPKKAAQPSQGKDPILSRKDFQKVLKQHVEDLKEKYKDERMKNRAKYGLNPESSSEEEEEEEEEEGSWDSDDEDTKPKGYIDKLKFDEDFAAQDCVARSMSSLDSSDEDEARRTRASKEVVSTRAASEYSVPVRKAKLNIVKEETNTNTKSKPKEEKSTEDKEEGSDAEEEEEEEEDEKNKIEEVFKKREKGETKEQKKERKALIKQFKQERKEKKKKFKENFDSKKKEHMTVAHKQANSLQGLSIYKLTI